MAFLLAIFLCWQIPVMALLSGPGITGRVEQYRNFPSRFVAARSIDVWLPPDYTTERNARYPVLYMHDGQNLFDPATAFGGTDWGVDETMSRLISEGRIRKAIVVGIWNSARRKAEYTPRKAMHYSTLDSISDVLPRESGPILSDEYLHFLVQEVKPFIDSVYRTLPDQQNTFMMGSSRGGLISAYALCEYPGVFRGAGCVSTHWPVDSGSVITYLAKHFPDPATHMFYFDYGTATLDSFYESYQVRMDSVMHKAGYKDGWNRITRKFPGEIHSESSWKKRVDLPLRFLLHK
jgi:predicted alpha/beta superfamily hydrolase